MLRFAGFPWCCFVFRVKLMPEGVNESATANMEGVFLRRAGRLLLYCLCNCSCLCLCVGSALRRLSGDRIGLRALSVRTALICHLCTFAARFENP